MPPALDARGRRPVCPLFTTLRQINSTGGGFKFVWRCFVVVYNELENDIIEATRA